MNEDNVQYRAKLARLADVLNFAVRRTGRWLRHERGLLTESDVESKGHGDFVSRADRTADTMLRDELTAMLPGSGVLSEEAKPLRGEGRWRWIVDPLDGTTNYLAGLPYWAVSVALEDRLNTFSGWGDIVLGAVYLPEIDRMYLARKGEGVSCNGHPISVSTRQDPRRATVSHWWPMDSGEMLDDFLEMIRGLHPKVGGIRNVGCPSAELALVADGSLDGFWASDMEAHDVAAGILLVREAGGWTGDPWGGDPLDSGWPVAGNEAIAGLLRREINVHIPQPPKGSGTR